LNVEYKSIQFDIRDSVACITLNRPEAANSINLEMSTDLMRAAIQCSEDPAIRAVVITGAGSMFCSGGDLKEFAAQGEHLPYHFKEVTAYLHAAISRLTRMNPPVVAAVNGAAAGAGMSLACACDIVVATEGARFTMGYTRAGLSPDGSSTYFLPRIVGLRRALELTLTNRVLSAQEALQWGIVTQVVPDAEVLARAQSIALQLAAGPTKALGASKRLLHSGSTETLETQMEYESQTIATIAHTTDTSEGIVAFLEKRTARYKGQ
jgi:2-(1,2-epoxy-1,2-dihydrophenyl)acetyl-CoA isomerase